MADIKKSMDNSMNKGAFLNCPRCGGKQVSSYAGDYDLHEYRKEKPESEQWGCYVWFELDCMDCGQEWGVKCEVTPVKLDVVD